MFKTQAQEIVFFFRGNLSIFIRDDLTVGSFQLILGAFRPFPLKWLCLVIMPVPGKSGFVLDCEHTFLVEFKLFNPETVESIDRRYSRVSRHLLVKYIKPRICQTFSLPHDPSCLLLAQSLPGFKFGLVLLQVWCSFYHEKNLVADDLSQGGSNLGSSRGGRPCRLLLL